MSGCRNQASNKGNYVAILLRPACKAQQIKAPYVCQ